MEPDRVALCIPRLEASFNQIVRIITSTASANQSVAPGPKLSGSQIVVLRALVGRGPLQVTEVANELGVTLSAATGLVDRLVKAGLAERDRDNQDRRVVWVKITPAGETALQAAEERRRAVFRAMVKSLSEEELAQLCDILERMG